MPSFHQSSNVRKIDWWVDFVRSPTAPRLTFEGDSDKEIPLWGLASFSRGSKGHLFNRWSHYYLLLNKINVSSNRNGLLLRQITFKILNGCDRYQ
jgi:hypothetical protein